MMEFSTPLEQRCKFKTKRLQIESWKQTISSSNGKNMLAKEIINILSPNIIQSLPPGWQTITKVNEAIKWIDKRDEEGGVFLVQLRENKKISGFLFLFEFHDTSTSKTELKLGYLLSENIWGMGFGTELIKGLITWSKLDGKIYIISGGVEENNIASMKVLEKNGFTRRKSREKYQNTIMFERQIGI